MLKRLLSGSIEAQYDLYNFLKHISTLAYPKVSKVDMLHTAFKVQIPCQLFKYKFNIFIYLH